MVELFEMNYYADEQHLPVLKDEIDRVITRNLAVIRKGWENGYHIQFLGMMTQEQAAELYQELEQVQKLHPSPVYDADEFREKYGRVEKASNKKDCLKQIYQNEIRINRRNDLFIFENDAQLELYLDLHHIFDLFFKDRYFSQNRIMDIILFIYPFVNFLPEKVLNPAANLISNGYISHLSHYIGLLNSLSSTDQIKIKKRFKEKYLRDVEHFHLERGAKQPDSAFLNHLINMYHRISNQVDDEKLNFFSPRQFDRDIEPQMHRYSDRHVQVFGSEENLKMVLKDKVLCTNKWVLNVLYEKLVLMNVKPIDKFYMNYFLSCLKFNDPILEVAE
ncbi:hypothetical protein [Paenibacillus caui]|uniref:hypothetical protein n=1 Tax=Paenibacillus caui TaxID=2873927 RepID=UPI001CAA3D10|nr:hypothetical protein [Paenibacillus caui]